ncbi:MAG: DUF6526 family protein [Ferruginibacter sp.]
MKEQNCKNHSQVVPMYHFVAGILIVAGLVGAVVNFVRACQHESGRIVAALLVVIFVITILFYWYARAFALRAQDRAIRAEENLRYFSMTGKLMDGKLRMGQIIALRFAPNEEFVALAARAVNENLRSGQIKEAIINWRADHHRV